MTPRGWNDTYEVHDADPLASILRPGMVMQVAPSWDKECLHGVPRGVLAIVAATDDEGIDLYVPSIRLGEEPHRFRASWDDEERLLLLDGLAELCWDPREDDE